VKEDLLMQIN